MTALVLYVTWTNTGEQGPHTKCPEQADGPL